jgi:hypothetical protein
MWKEGAPVPKHHQGARTLADRRGNRLVDLGGVSRLQVLQLHPQGAGPDLHRLEFPRLGGEPPEHRHAGQPGDHVSGPKFANPVTFPPGCARLGTFCAKEPPPTMMMGIVVVAF